MSGLNLIRLFAFLCFYMVVSYAFIEWKYLVYFKVSEAVRPLLVVAHFLIVISNIGAFITFILIDKHIPTSRALSWAGLIIALAGALFLIWAILTLKIATFAPQNGQLVTIGPHRMTAHPIYFGGVVAGFGLSIWSASTLGLVYSLVIMLMLIIVSKEEEKDLAERFGQAYLEYKKNTFLGRIFSFVLARRS